MTALLGLVLLVLGAALVLAGLPRRHRPLAFLALLVGCALLIAGAEVLLG